MKELDTTKIKQIVDDFVAALKQKLDNNGTNSSGKLGKSIRGKIKYDGKWLNITLSIENYWKYVEYGTRPHFPPVDAIQKWIQVKPVLPQPLKNGKLPTQKQLAFLIARKISRVGTKPQPFFNPTLEDFDLANKIYNAVMEEITEQISENIDEELKNV